MENPTVHSNRFSQLALSIATCVLLFAMSAIAADVEFTLSPRETWIGSPAIMKIVVRGGSSIAVPILPRVEGVDFEVQAGRQTTSSMQISNGTVTRDSTTVINVMITPSRAGVITIPPITIDVDGTKFSSKPTSISTAVATTGDLLQAEVFGEGVDTWVGQPLTVTLRIVVKPFQSAEHRVTLGEADMWQFMNQDRCEFGPFTKSLNEMAQRRQRPAGREELIDGQSFLIYEIPATITPTASGVPDFSDVLIAWNYPTALTVQRGFFSRNNFSVSATKPIRTSASASGIEVRALPEIGQPESFRGAVGSFTLSATAKPIRVAVGDPITLTVIITDLSGTQPLDTMQPPPLAIPSLEASFRMPTAPLAGSIEGNKKTFTQTLRPTKLDIRQIPPIEFSWFDTTTGGYRTAMTKPIDITVVASEHIATDAILGAPTGTQSPMRQLTASEGGLTANVAPTLAMVRDDSSSLGAFTSGALLLAPPIACAALWLARRRSDRLRSDVSFAREQGAWSRASKRLGSGDGFAAIVGYIADRMNCPSGTLTRSEARECLSNANAPNELLDRVDQLLQQVERARFSANGKGEISTEIVAQARSCIQSLDKLDWRLARVVSGGSRS